MIEHFKPVHINYSYYSVIHNPVYRKELAKNLSTNYYLNSYLQQLSFKKIPLQSSYFIIDTYKKHNFLPFVTKEAYKTVQKKFKGVDADDLTDNLDDLYERNEHFARSLVKITSNYPDMGQSLIVYRLLNEQILLNAGKDIALPPLN